MVVQEIKTKMYQIKIILSVLKPKASERDYTFCTVEYNTKCICTLTLSTPIVYKVYKYSIHLNL